MCEVGPSSSGSATSSWRVQAHNLVKERRGAGLVKDARRVRRFQERAADSPHACGIGCTRSSGLSKQQLVSIFTHAD